MKPILLSLLVLTCFTCKAQSIYSALHLNDDDYYKYGKPVKITERRTYHSQSGNVSVESNIKQFDDAGMLTTEERYDEDGKLKARLFYANDTTRKLKLSRMIERWARFPAYHQETATYSYNEKGFLVTTVDSSNRGIAQITKTTPDERGNPVELYIFNSAGDSMGKETAAYDYEANQVITTVFANDGRQISTNSNKIRFGATAKALADSSKYNQYGDLLSYTSENFNGTKIFYECEYKYDKTGNYTEMKEYIVTGNTPGKKKRKLSSLIEREITYKRTR
jgi:hypothetical protein